MSKQKEIQKTVVSYEVYSEEGFSHPSTFFIVDCLGNNVYYHTRDRKVAQEEVDKDYGKGKYSVKATKESKGSGNTLGARGSVNSKSRSGSYTQKIYSNQGR